METVWQNCLRSPLIFEEKDEEEQCFSMRREVKASEGEERGMEECE